MEGSSSSGQDRAVQLQRDFEVSRLEEESLAAAYLKLMPVIGQCRQSSGWKEEYDPHVRPRIAIGG